MLAAANDEVDAAAIPRPVVIRLDRTVPPRGNRDRWPEGQAVELAGNRKDTIAHYPALVSSRPPGAEQDIVRIGGGFRPRRLPIRGRSEHQPVHLFHRPAPPHPTLTPIGWGRG